jgi:hypothetical protein
LYSYEELDGVSIVIRYKDGRFKYLANARHVPRLKMDLLLVSWFIDARVVIFAMNMCKIVKGALVLANGIKVTTHVEVNSNVAISEKREVTKEAFKGVKGCVLWHRRIAHLNDQSLQDIHSKGMVKVMNFNSDSFKFCESCVLG